MKLDEKESSRTAGMKPESASYSRREKTGVPTIPLNGGTSAALHCAARCTHPRHPICSTQPRTPRGEKSERNDEVDHERKRKREGERKVVVPLAASCQSYIVISSYLPNDKSARSFSTRYPLRFMRELIVDLTKKYRRYIDYLS
ncbi:unnamed protein product [Lasius platythorax]|uniref:Uncharacterized protein n=1 Tax=Lasius platythorax TaxID=488582 RepID=A0AAV2NKJ8_9HYME